MRILRNINRACVFIYKVSIFAMPDSHSNFAISEKVKYKMTVYEVVLFSFEYQTVFEAL